MTKPPIEVVARQSVTIYVATGLAEGEVCVVITPVDADHAAGLEIPLDPGEALDLAGRLTAEVGGAVLLPAEGTDAELVRLARELDAAQARLDTLDATSGGGPGEVMDAAVDEAFGIAAAHADHRATTLEGLRAKAQAVLWYHSDDPLDLGSHPEMLVLKSIVEDLLAMPPAAGAVLLTSAAAAQLRNALRDGYDTIARLEPVNQRDLEAMAGVVEALKLLGEPPAPSGVEVVERDLDGFTATLRR